jgi:hypothetical protein
MQERVIKTRPLPHNWRAVHPTTYIEVNDLIGDDGKWKTIPVTTSKIELHVVKNPKTMKDEEKLVAFFEKGSKGLILNVTLNKVLDEITGTRDPHAWVGVPLELFIEANVSTPNGRKDVVRFRKGKGNGKVSAPNPTQPPDAAMLTEPEIQELLDDEQVQLGTTTGMK